MSTPPWTYELRVAVHKALMLPHHVSDPRRRMDVRVQAVLDGGSRRQETGAGNWGPQTGMHRHEVKWVTGKKRSRSQPPPGPGDAEGGGDEDGGDDGAGGGGGARTVCCCGS